MGPTWPFVDVDLRDAIDAGAVPGPRMMVAGNYVSSTGGAGDARQFSIYVDVPMVKNLADGPDEIVKAVRTNLKNGADFIKILATGAVLSKGISPGAQQYSDAEIQAAVTEAAPLGPAGGLARARRERHHRVDQGRRPDRRSRIVSQRRGDCAVEGLEPPRVLRADAVHGRCDRRGRSGRTASRPRSASGIVRFRKPNTADSNARWRRASRLALPQTRW